MGVASKASSDPGDIAERLLKMLTAGDTQGALVAAQQLAAQRDEFAAQRDEFAAKVAEQDGQIIWLRRMLFGRRSEKLSAEELGQLVLAYGGSEADAAAKDPTLPAPSQSGDEDPDEELEQAKNSERRKKRRGHRGRTKLSPDLERIVSDVAVPQDERGCLHCGTEMTVFGHVEHERLEFVPAKFVVHVERREKLACRQCKGDAVTADRASDLGLPLRVGPSVLAYLIESKCDDALPIHRQCDQFARMGFELPPSTAYGYWRYATDLLLPLSDALLGIVLEHRGWVGIDDTRLDVLDPKHKNGKYRGHLWCFITSTGLVAYRFTSSWEAKEIAPWFQLIGPETFVQIDDYKGYSSMLPGPDGTMVPMVDPSRRLGCMMHVRRRFFDALKAGDKRAAQPVQWIQDIYKVEELARGRPPDERLALRLTHSIAPLDHFDTWVDARAKTLGKTGKLVDAVRYAKQQRPFVRRCFSDGRFEIDNGAVERRLRKVAVGRNNFLFTGSAPAGQRLAGAYSLVQSCRALGIPTREYLIDVIDKLEAGWPARRLTDLLPHRWSPDLAR